MSFGSDIASEVARGLAKWMAVIVFVVFVVGAVCGKFIF
jgi:hypothetical protein